MDNETGVVPEQEQEVAAPVIEEPEGSGETGVTTGQVDSASPAEGSEEPIQETEEVAGLRSGIQAERSKRQQMEAQNQILNQELQQLRNQIPQQQKSDPFEDLADDDIVQVGSVKQYMKALRDEFSGEFQRQRIETSTRIAKSKYEDYEATVNKLTQVANEKQIKIILASDDPAELAYNFVKGSPEYINTVTSQAKQKAGQQVIDSVNQHLKSPKTLSKVGGGKRDPNTMFQGMSDEEFNKVQSAVMMNNTKEVEKYFK
jgi:hypothetical protein